MRTRRLDDALEALEREGTRLQVELYCYKMSSPRKLWERWAIRESLPEDVLTRMFSALRC